MTPSSEEQAVGRQASFFDLQVNGFAGVDFQQEDLAASDLARAVGQLRSFGTDKILLTLITDRMDRLARKLERIEEICRSHPDLSETIVGYHLEGPWLLSEPGFCGAHEASLMQQPNTRDFLRLFEAANGRVRLVTLAPELPGAAELTERLVACGVQVAAGHTNASEAQIDEAIRAGLSLCTHLGNGVPQHLHRHDNIVQRLLARDELVAVFIPDGIHLPFHVLKNYVRAKPPGKVLFTTDCMAAAGAGPGRYTLGSLVTEVGPDGVVRQPGHASAFAGSSLTMDMAFHNVQRFLGWSREDALAACSKSVTEYCGEKASTPNVSNVA